MGMTASQCWVLPRVTRSLLFIKPFSIPLDRRSQGRHEERVAPTLPPSARNWDASQCQTFDSRVKQLTPWFMDHVLRYTKQKPRNKSLLTAKGRKAGRAKRKDPWFMIQKPLSFDSRGAQARRANEYRTICHGARCKNQGNLKQPKSFNLGQIVVFPISKAFFFIALAGILWDCYLLG